MNGETVRASGNGGYRMNAGGAVFATVSEMTVDRVNGGTVRINGGESNER